MKSFNFKSAANTKEALSLSSNRTTFLAGGMTLLPALKLRLAGYSDIINIKKIKTLSGIANSFSHNLIIRAADVILKERRPLVLMVRETPLHKGHLKAMIKTADLGAIIHPPVPAFYNKPNSIEEIVNQSIGRALDHLGIKHEIMKRWKGE